LTCLNLCVVAAVPEVVEEEVAELASPFHSPGEKTYTYGLAQTALGMEC